MRYYNGKRTVNGRTRLILFRILFTVTAAVIIIAIAIMIGNHLKAKVEEAEKTENKTYASTGLESERHLEENSAYSDYSPTVFGSALSVKDYLNRGENDDNAPKNIKNDVKELAESYDTLTLDLTDESGALIYTSPAMCQISHIPYDGQSEEEKLIRDALAAAEETGLRTCAIVLPIISETTLSGAAAVDGELIKELYEMGFTEVLFDLTAMFDGDITSDAAARIRNYIRECSSQTDGVCKLGVMLSSDVFLEPANAKQIQVIADTSSFLATKFDLDEVYITTEAFNSVSDAVTSMLGNFSVYNMRVMIDSRFDIISAAVYAACSSHGVNNVAFLNYILPENLVYSDLPIDNDTVGNHGNDSPADNTNPYATTADNPSIGATTDIGTDHPSDGEDGAGEDNPWF